MIMVNNPFGQDPMDFNNETAADRIGHRIRTIRIARGLTPSELADRIGISADMLQKYENGQRKPKNDKIKVIADALGVSTLALTDPVTTNYIGVMYAMFEIESHFNAHIEEAGENHSPGMCLMVDFREELYRYMEEWFNVYSKMKDDYGEASTDEEKKKILDDYHDWEWNFPQGITDRTEKSFKKARLKRKIDELQAAYDSLDDDEE